jgi:inhibitor of cysteine peptidase
MKQFLRRFAFFVVVALLVVLVACGTGPIELGGNDSGSELRLNIGDEFVVELESNASTGYSWELREPQAIKMVQLRSSVYTAPESEVVGTAGIQTFTFEAVEFGAGVVRLEYIRTFDEVIIPDKVVEYIAIVDGAPWPPDRPRPSTTTVTAPEPTSSTTEQSSSTAAPSTSDTTTTAPMPTPVRVGDLFDGTGARPAVVEGFVVWDEVSARLCDVLMESFPPQCGSPWVVIVNPASLTDPLESAQGVRWTQGDVPIAGYFDGDRFVVGPDVSVAEPADDQVRLVDAFVAFAQSPGPDTAVDVPFAEAVVLGLGPDIQTTVSKSDLGNPASWVIDAEEFRAYAGPFSALELVNPPVKTLVGQHARCVGVPVAAPAGFEDAVRISLQPEVATSCLEWWAVDLFIGDDGTIRAVTMDLYGP